MTDSGFDRLEKKSTDWADREAGRLADRPVRTFGKWAAITLAGVLAATLFFGAIGFVAGWFNTGVDIVRPANVKEQYAQVIQSYKALEVAAQNVCAAKGVKPDPNSPTLLEDPNFAYVATYNNIKVDYNRRQNNIFEAKLVGPKGYPRNAPDLAVMEAKVC